MSKSTAADLSLIKNIPKETKKVTSNRTLINDHLIDDLANIVNDYSRTTCVYEREKSIRREYDNLMWEYTTLLDNIKKYIKLRTFSVFAEMNYYCLRADNKDVLAEYEFYLIKRGTGGSNGTNIDLLTKFNNYQIIMSENDLIHSRMMQVFKSDHKPDLDKYYLTNISHCHEIMKDLKHDNIELISIDLELAQNLEWVKKYNSLLEYDCAKYTMKLDRYLYPIQEIVIEKNVDNEIFFSHRNLNDNDRGLLKQLNNAIDRNKYHMLFSCPN